MLSPILSVIFTVFDIFSVLTASGASLAVIFYLSLLLFGKYRRLGSIREAGSWGGDNAD